jgi:non-ribosomal peptide synthetase component E (peptide arylation enzyme)
MSATVTLVELLHARAQTSLNDITFLNDEGHSASVLSYAELYRTGLRLSYALRQSGLVPGTSNVVLARFDDVRKSILTFWACCLGKWLIAH